MEIKVYTDGACVGNPGPGGWGSVLECGDYKKEIYGGAILTTNNIMELTAVIEALKLVKKKSSIHFQSLMLICGIIDIDRFLA